MLINTVILLLRDALPVAILMGMLLAFFSVSKREKWLFFFYAFALTLVLVFSRNEISQWWQGSGYEIMSCALYGVVYLCLLKMLIKPRGTMSWSVALFGVVLIALHFADFLIYLFAYSAQTGVGVALFVGSLLGGGICVSISMLLFIGLVPYRHKPLFRTLLIIFTVGHVADISHLLQQTGHIEESSAVWDTQHFISDESEYGHLLSAFTGYQSRPDKAYLLLWTSLMLFAVLCMFIGNRRHSSQFKKEQS